MAEKPTTTSDTDARNEGEGTPTAARQYNDAQGRSAQSGKVREKAGNAARSLDRDQRALRRAEAVGRGHAKADDPKVGGKH
jgi:hypothetical protein